MRRNFIIQKASACLALAMLMFLPGCNFKRQPLSLNLQGGDTREPKRGQPDDVPTAKTVFPVKIEKQLPPQKVDIISVKFGCKHSSALVSVANNSVYLKKVRTGNLKRFGKLYIKEVDDCNIRLSSSDFIRVWYIWMPKEEITPQNLELIFKSYLAQSPSNFMFRVYASDDKQVIDSLIADDYMASKINASSESENEKTVLMYDPSRVSRDTLLTLKGKATIIIFNRFATGAQFEFW